MAAAAHKPNQPPPDGEEDVILLTEVVGPGEDKAPEPASGGLAADVPTEPSAPEPAPHVAADPSLDELLASLNNLPEDLGAGGPAVAAATPSVQGAAGPSLEEAVRRQVEALLREDRLKEIIREMLAEKVESLSREVLPQVFISIVFWRPD